MRLLLFALLFILACNTKTDREKKILEDDQMVELLVDYHLIQSFHELKGLPQDTLNLYNNKHFNIILKEKGVSREDFQSTFDYYMQNPEDFMKVYEQVVVELDSVAAAQ